MGDIGFGHIWLPWKYTEYWPESDLLASKFAHTSVAIVVRDNQRVEAKRKSICTK